MGKPATHVNLTAKILLGSGIGTILLAFLLPPSLGYLAVLLLAGGITLALMVG